MGFYWPDVLPVTQPTVSTESTERNATTIVADLLWSPYVIGQTIIFLPCGFFFFLPFFSSPNLSRRRLDVCHTSTHGVTLERI